VPLHESHLISFSSAMANDRPIEIHTYCLPGPIGQSDASSRPNPIPIVALISPSCDPSRMHFAVLRR